jgi:hypothetical protein
MAPEAPPTGLDARRPPGRAARGALPPFHPTSPFSFAR